MISWFLVVVGKKKMLEFKCDKYFKYYLEYFGVEKCVIVLKYFLIGIVQFYKVLNKKKNMDKNIF